MRAHRKWIGVALAGLVALSAMTYLAAADNTDTQVCALVDEVNARSEPFNKLLHLVDDLAAAAATESADPPEARRQYRELADRTEQLETFRDVHVDGC